MSFGAPQPIQMSMGGIQKPNSLLSGANVSAPAQASSTFTPRNVRAFASGSNKYARVGSNLNMSMSKSSYNMLTPSSGPAQLKPTFGATNGGFLNSFRGMFTATGTRAASTTMSATVSNSEAAKPERRVAKSLIQEMTPQEREKFNGLTTIILEDMELVELLKTIGEGWAYPLTRFMNEQELLESMNMNTVTCEEGKKHILSVPIVMHITESQKETIKEEKMVAIKCPQISDEVLAVIEDPEIFDNRKEEITTKTFGTRSVVHPKVEKIEKEQGPFLLSGKKMRFTQHIKLNDGLDHYRLTPEQIYKLAEERGADAVYAFQVRNPLHNGHCLLLKDTR
mmetsp:Transcript_17881/g.30391  ORF Transcript_17881/g.30391 Transcript_17881/m.30391 type:complete len:338 (+) Transcript_17881:229-1242(+)